MSSGTGGNYPAPVTAAESAGVNAAFQPFPYPNTTQAANNAYNNIGGLVNTGLQSGLNSAAQNALNYGQSLPGQLAPIAQQGLAAGTNIYNNLSGQAGIPMQTGQNVYNTLAKQSVIPEQAGQSIYNSLTSQAGAPIAAGNSIYNTLASQAGRPIAAGNTLMQQGQAQYANLSPYVTMALQQGFDPQNALYNRQFQQQQQQNMAAQAQSGVGQSPYAAGLTAQGNENFNIDWQNNQLARQAMGAQTAEGLTGAAMGAANTGLQGLLSGYQTGTAMDTAAINALLGGYQTGTAMDTAASNALNSGYQTGSGMLLGGANALNQGFMTGTTMDTAAMNAMSQGISDYGNITGLGISGMQGLLGTGGNLATQAQGLSQQQISDYLAYLQGSSSNAANAISGQLGTLNAGTNLYGATNQGNAQQQALLNSSLGGLGALGGTLLGSNLGGLSNIASGAFTNPAGGLF